MRVGSGMVKRLPLWGAILPLVLGSTALVAMVSGAGITGDNPAVVQEPLTISAAPGGAKLVLSSGESTDLVIFNDDTSFAGAAETYSGDSYAIKVLLTNASNADVVQRLSIDAPEGFRFNVISGDRISVSQETATTFLVRVDTDAASFGTLTNAIGDIPQRDELRITVLVSGQVVPGFYRITYNMAQFGPREL